MARDAEATLPLLLKSIRPYVSQIVVGVDVLTKDRTAKVAKKGGADDVFPLKVSDWHECVVHERQLAQDFSAARMETFTHLNPDLDFWLWLDADDVLVGGERLAEFCATIPADSVGAWLAYEYAAVQLANGERRVNTLFSRERLLRTHLDGEPLAWTWQGRVHETVSPDRNASWVPDGGPIRVVHQPGTHMTPASAMRNLLLLEIDYEEESATPRGPTPRTVFYLGNQHFSMGNWQAAVNWYEQLGPMPNVNPYELWQADVYMGLAYKQLGDVNNAKLAAFAAIDVVPFHPEPFYLMAALATMVGDNEKALHWTKLGRQQAEPPFFVFKNPLDYSFNQRVVAGHALFGLGRVTDAKHEWQQAADVFVDDHLTGVLADATACEENIAKAQAFVALAPTLNGQALDLYQALPDDVKAYGRTREIVMPNILRGRLGLTPRISFFCGQSWEPWYPGSIDTTGIGGSETAVIEIAKRFARDGWTVDVFNNADRFEGIHDGVGYWDAARSNWTDPVDVHVCWRQPLMVPHPHAGKNLLWCHDLNYGPDTQVGFDQWAKAGIVAGVSEWHAQMLGRYYGIDATWVPNGINLERFLGSPGDLTKDAGSPKKVPFRAVYASSPDRGLATLLAIWPELVKVEPTAELHVAYGWETIDRMIAAGNDRLAAFKADMERRINETPNVVWRGRLGQRDLAQLYGESVAWLYPTDFLEVSCISAMESMAGGCVPVTTAAGALSETVGTAGLLIPGPTTSRPYKDTFQRVATGVLCEANTKLTYSHAGRERAKAFAWDHAYTRWLEVLGLSSGYGRPRNTSRRANWVTA